MRRLEEEDFAAAAEEEEESERDFGPFLEATPRRLIPFEATFLSADLAVLAVVLVVVVVVLVVVVILEEEEAVIFRVDEAEADDVD